MPFTVGGEVGGGHAGCKACGMACKVREQTLPAYAPPGQASRHAPKDIAFAQKNHSIPSTSLLGLAEHPDMRHASAPAGPLARRVHSRGCGQGLTPTHPTTRCEPLAPQTCVAHAVFPSPYPYPTYPLPLRPHAHATSRLPARGLQAPRWLRTRPWWPPPKPCAA